jgi:surface protein
VLIVLFAEKSHFVEATTNFQLFYNPLDSYKLSVSYKFVTCSRRQVCLVVSLFCRIFFCSTSFSILSLLSSLRATVPLMMSTSHDLVAAAKAPELHFRKCAIVAFAVLFLVVLGVIAITSTPSRKKGSETFFLFHRTLLTKDATTPTPTVACFTTSDELYDAVDKFMKGSEAEMEELEETYGLPIGAWCVSEIQDFSQLFNAYSENYRATFNEDISAWDVSKASTMSEMFREAPLFNQDLSSWNTSSVEDLNSMFYGASSFNNDLAEWDVSKV